MGGLAGWRQTAGSTLATDVSVTQQAQADDDACSGAQAGVRTHLTLASKWHGSFDESLEEEADAPNALEQLPHEPNAGRCAGCATLQGCNAAGADACWARCCAD